MPTVADITSEIEKIAPLDYAESFDNVGLLIGRHDAEVTKVLVTLDTTEAVVDEAIEKGANLIISFHPIVFSGLKKITGKNYVERVVIKAIANHINIYATHTALDNSLVGVNHRFAEQLNLKNTEILIPQEKNLRQLVTYVPSYAGEKLRATLFAAGAGNIGKYTNCSYNNLGFGTFEAKKGANPTIGEIEELVYQDETQISVVFPKHLEKKIIKTLHENHPYETVAYQIYQLENHYHEIGIGMIGDLEEALSEKDFLEFVKEKMQTEAIRHSQFLGKSIKKIAVLGGSGSFAISAAKAKKADAFITADLKYHQFFEAENQILLTDIGHFESEQFTKNLLTAYLSEKFPKFAVLNSEINTNPVKYF